MTLSPREIVVLEGVAARVWPAMREERFGDWRLYATAGFSNRINACWPLGDPGRNIADAITIVEDWYAAQGLRPLFKVVDGVADPRLTDALSARGYRPRTETLTMTVPLTGRAADPDVALADTVDTAFLNLFASAVAARPGDARERLETLARIPAPRAYACLSVDGAPAAIGAVAVDGDRSGISAMRTSSAHRRRGLARRVLQTLAAFAAEAGAATAYLQVETDNAGAIALYRDEGFEEAYRYRYWSPA